MDRETYEKAYKFTIDVLNSIDIDKYLQNTNELSEVMRNIEQDYKEVTYNEYMKGHFFNVMNESEFGDYLRNRYGDKIYVYEYTSYRFMHNN